MKMMSGSKGSMFFMGEPNDLYKLSNIRNISTKEKSCTEIITSQLCKIPRKAQVARSKKGPVIKMAV